jgi:hypothetical protein
MFIVQLSMVVGYFERLAARREVERVVPNALVWRLAGILKRAGDNALHLLRPLRSFAAKEVGV